MTKYNVLQQYFGYDRFLEGQEVLIDNVLGHRDVIGIMPTGAGKSLCFQIPALVFSGITIVISPLISLMKDQVHALIQNGIPAAYINSFLSANQMDRVLQNASAKQYKIIYVTPERLNAESFLRFAKKSRIALLAVDEAHCVSHWGQNFRPSYRMIRDFVVQLPMRPVIATFTATATHEVKDDIKDMIGLQTPFELTTGFDRKNLYFDVDHPRDKYSRLLDFLENKVDKSGIVYCSTRKAVEEVCESLCTDGYSASRYHAGLPEAERIQNQDDFLYDRKRIMVATNAFGMGIDKSNVSFVVHYNMPKSIESYYQEAGRAGRDGAPAECLLLYSGRDVVTNQFLINHSSDNSDLDEDLREKIKEKDRARLKDMTFYCHTKGCLRAYILSYFGDKAQNYCGSCGNCNTNFTEVDITEDAQKILSCVYRTGQRFGISTIVNTLRGSQSKKIIDLHLDHVKTYGILAQTSVHKIRDIINHLILENYLLLTDTMYPVLKLTKRSRTLLLGQEICQMKLLKDKFFDGNKKQKKISVYKGSSLSQSSDSALMDSTLFETLKAVRLRLAHEADVPAFVIFSDATLIDMCRKRPTSLSDFLNVKGVGEMKLERYGHIFIPVIKEAFCSAQK